MKVQEKVKEILKNSPLSQGDEAIIEEFVKKGEVRRYSPNYKIVREGEEGESMFLILEGEVEVFCDTNGRKFLDILKEGDFFGEFSLFTGGKRHATVKTRKDTICLEITKSIFEELSDTHPQFAKVVVDFYKIRVLDTLLAHTTLFSTLKPEERKEVLACFEPAIIEKGEDVVKEGDEGDAIYVIKDGIAEVFTTDAFGKEVKLAELCSGDFFGEIAVITGNPRTATVRAAEKLRLLRMEREDFIRLCDKYPEIRIKAEEEIEKRTDSTLMKIMEVEKEKIKKP